MLHTMILAGGGGTRFWPRSRQKRPKQFLTLSGDRSLLQQAFDRAEALAPPERTWVVTAEAYREETQQQLRLSPDRIVGEPVGRDTAAAIGLGAALIARHDPDAVMLVTPADHVIEPNQEFRRAVQVAEQVTQDQPDALVTFGIVPTFASTGYGYIQRGTSLGQRLGLSVSRVQKFKEKPDADLAEQYVSSGQYFWNSGIFVWRAATVLATLRARMPALHAALTRVADAWSTPKRDAVLRAEYPTMEKTSIDYAVMEHAGMDDQGTGVVVQAPFRWDDVGSWLALERLNPQDADHNTILGNHAGIRTHDCVIVSDSGKLIATIGVDNLLIVQDGDAILVADRRDESTVKALVDLLRSKGLEKYL